jgi:prolyl oligopeptidase
MRGYWPLSLILLGAACVAPPGPVTPAAPVGPASPVPIIVETTPVPAPSVPREATSYDLFGERILDPYLWLEDARDPRVQDFTLQQNQRFEAALSGLAERPRLRRRAEALLGIGSVWAPTVTRTASGGSRYFTSRRDGLQNQPVLWVRDGVDGPDRVLLDPNGWSASGTVALDWYYPSWDGSRVAYGVSHDGSEDSELRVIDVAAGQDLADRISRTRHCSLCWSPDGAGFYYSRLAAPGTVPPGEENYRRSVYYHSLGADPERDRLVFGADRPPTEYPSCTIAPGGRWLLVHTSKGWNQNELYLADTTAPTLDFVEMTRGAEQTYVPLVLDDAVFIRTDEAASRGALYAADPRRPQRERWRPVIGEHATDVLTGFDVVGGQVLATYLAGGVVRLERFDLRGRSLGAVALPGPGTSDGMSGRYDGHEAFYDFESFAHPTRVFHLDLTTGTSRIWAEVPSPIGGDAYETVQREARSRDGARVPYVVVRGRASDRGFSDRPTLLYGYGGFGLSLLPRFSALVALWLERGGVYVQANLRGGGERGEDWHRAGQLDHKQNSFDDFIAVAEDLARRGETRADKLSIYGRSNGGLLVAAALTQHPELFRAAVAGVPLTDMLRYHRFLLGKLWVPEYGSAESRDQLAWLRLYSPYQKVRDGVRYPAVLLTTASSDARVDPLHARKLTAALQHASGSDWPVLLSTDLEAGHGAGKPVSRLAAETADIVAFLLWQLGELCEKPGASGRLEDARLPLAGDSECD